MNETEKEGLRIDDEFYGNPWKKRGPAKRFAEKHIIDDRMAGHITRAERFD